MLNLPCVDTDSARPVGLDGLEACRRFNLPVNDELPHLLAFLLNLQQAQQHEVTMQHLHFTHKTSASVSRTSFHHLGKAVGMACKKGRGVQAFH